MSKLITDKSQQKTAEKYNYIKGIKKKEDAIEK